tara:strand:- start:8539 stop:9603 length:1065 start_codon:yes stop_codon:yes gene_type:complete
MVKYYTRACNFYYGKHAKQIIKKQKALPLCGNSSIAFDCIEVFSRNKKNEIKSKYIQLNKLKNLNKNLKNHINRDLKKISSKRKNFLKNTYFNQPLIMGILNLTPDSFSDGGKYNSLSKSSKHITQMVNDGARIIDVGGESTRPGSKTVDPIKEWNRIKYVIKNFKKKFKRTCLSVDTRKSEIMVKSAKYGADIINDISGFNFDKTSIKKIKNIKVSKILHHIQGTPATMQIKPKYRNVLLDIYDFFEDNLKNKLKDKKIILDPGIGFGKNLKHNLTLISKISLFHSLGFPILVGTSRKRFINQISGKYDSKDRTGGTLASVLYLLSQGVQIFRVHNVKEIKQGILVFEKILNS